MKFAKRVTYLIPVIAIMLAGCANAQPASIPDKENTDFYLALPRVVIDINDQGVPSIAGISPEALNLLTMGMLDLSQYAIPKEYVDWLKSTNTQNLEFAFNGDGAFVYANGKPLPHIGFTDESVNNLSDVAGTVGETFAPDYAGYMPLLKRLLPLARRLGLDVAVRLPRGDGAAEIPLRDLSAAPAAEAEQPGSGAVQFRVVVTYDDQGVPSVAGISAKDLEDLTGYDMTTLKLDPSFVKLLMDKGIQNVSMRSEGAGLTLAVNDKTLPNLVCNADCLKNSSELIGALNTYPGMEQVNQLVTTFGPELRNVNTELALRFPMAPGSKAIPLPWAGS